MTDTDSSAAEQWFRFLRFCIDDRQPVPDGLGRMDWDALYRFLSEQALLGVGFNGVERLGTQGGVPRRLLLCWYAQARQIRQKNAVLNRRCGEIAAHLRAEGRRCCILKGQGNARMYPDPGLRAPGDIDVWVEGSREETMRLVRRRFPHTPIRFHHVDYPIYDDAPVELHFMPASMNNPVCHRRLARWFDSQRDRQFANCVALAETGTCGNTAGNTEGDSKTAGETESCGKTAGHTEDGGGVLIPVPTADFNLVYQLTHMMHHFFDEGIGLRQMMDYYFLIKSEKLKVNNGRDDLDEMLRYLGLRKFAGAVMYVLQTVFGLENRYLIVPADEWRGRTLLAEIMHGGNFGQHSGLGQHSAGAKYLLKIRRNMHFVRQYPAEALCEPVFRTWHFFWRIWNR